MRNQSTLIEEPAAGEVYGAARLPPGAPGALLLPELLEEQQQLTAVERFARAHAALDDAQATGRYRSLLPASPPAPGQQYAFEVNLDLCSGCKACVTACHALNGLDEEETWRSVGVLIAAPATPAADGPGCGGEEKTTRVRDAEPPGPEPWQRHVTTACHHCVDPACLNGCPVLAYDKDPITGIVRHLDDQCIGCQYCVMKCPYEVPRYSPRLGIVRKCDLCHQRLGRDEAPACAQACPNEAIRITLVRADQLALAFRGEDHSSPPQREAPWREEPGPASRFGPRTELNAFLPCSPEPALTLPATRYISGTPWPVSARGADHDVLRLEPPHWPLILMLVLTQAATGVLAAAAFLQRLDAGAGQSRLEVVGFGLLVAGLASAAGHLGRPLKAWRSFLGWRRSWLSREILLFQAFAAAGGMLLLGSWCGAGPGFDQALLSGVVCLGALSVGASAMVYVDTARPWWAARRSFGDFIGTTLLLGATVTAVVHGAAPASDPGNGRVAAGSVLAALVVRTLLFVWRQAELDWASRHAASAIHSNARALAALRPGAVRAAGSLYLLATICGLLALWPQTAALPVWLPLGAAATLASEILARYVFFVASAARRMPGGIVA